MKTMNEHFNGKQVQIYIVENDGGFVKIGVSEDAQKRFEQLSGSNGGGHKLTRAWTSPKTWLYSMEGTLHTFFSMYRVPGTEWFKDLPFETAVAKAVELFSSDEYRRCNEIRKNFYEQRGEIE